MDIQEALFLMAEIRREIKAASIIYNEPHERDYFYGSDLPHEDLYVVTEEGERFGVMFFEGEYSDYHEHIAWSREEWRNKSSDWRSALFNPGGEWSRRRIVQVDPHPRWSTNIRILYDCGHETSAIPGRPANVGDVRICYQCREEAVGLTQEMIEDAISAALASKAKETHD